MRYLCAFLLALTMYGATLVAPIVYHESSCTGKELLGSRTLEQLYEQGEIGPMCLVWLR